MEELKKQRALEGDGGRVAFQDEELACTGDPPPGSKELGAH